MVFGKRCSRTGWEGEENASRGLAAFPPFVVLARIPSPNSLASSTDAETSRIVLVSIQSCSASFSTQSREERDPQSRSSSPNESLLRLISSLQWGSALQMGFEFSRDLSRRHAPC